MSNITQLRCINCSRTYQPRPGFYTCPICGSTDGILDVEYDYDYINKYISKESLAGNREPSMWRYRPFLPVAQEGPLPPLRVGWSPLYRAGRLAAELGLKELYIKDDGINPTGSLKDRPSAVAVARALAEGAGVVACSSTGNAASSLAGAAASVGLKAVIFVPGRAPQGKVAQLLIFGATVISVQGSYEDAFRLSAAAIEEHGWYNRNAAINPYLVEGKKTACLEVAEQLQWEVPDWVVLSVGDGCTMAGAWKAWVDLKKAGWIEKLPRMLGVQAEGCCPITRAFREGTRVRPMEENTLADSIAVGVPRNPEKALRAVRDSRGTMINVSDEEILAAMRVLGRTSGVFGEPAGVAGTAGLIKAVREGIIKPGERIVVLVTGNGLKDVANAIKAAGEPVRVAPSLEALHKALGDLKLPNYG
ncbi:MAG: threonine synthase [Moorella sp. (in: firmicutes)]|uniref:threonine synthase n=1 Tax=Moorella sp. E308F TaxID=2572682 RepID=UPI0010FFC036|nr:threonine synthase [Moorella sp. E308F]MDK2815933.1 threonine synthase [Moorella sp. (in: firmicutes)]MDK2895343.1 threonine synthase [Moorella sp. (in: firmicutes)]GEA13941.1 threonine synthase [Moorella sp. E308F]